MTAAITFDLLARDQASAAVRKVGDELETLNGRATKFARGFAASLGLAFGAEKLVEFGKSAVSAFTAAQSAEARLENALKTFPKLADTNRAALDKLNDSIERRTGFLSRDVAAGEANLAQFNLTGAQLKQITPLLVDYADKTGTAIPEAATLLGRALLGNQRALKSIGITMPTVTASAKDLAKAHAAAESTTSTLAKAQDHLQIAEAEMAAKRKVTVVDELHYRDAQNAVRDAYAKNQAALAALRGEQDRTAKSGSYFDQVVTALKGKVGGFADQESQTAQGQLRKLSAEFDRTKVEVGAKLLPVVLSFGHFLNDTLIPDLEHMAGWLKRNSDAIVPLAKFIGGLTLAVYATNTATKLWASASKAAATWTGLLGGAASVTAPRVAAEGAAAAEAAAAQGALAASAGAATAAMETEGAVAVATAGRLAGAAAAAGGLLATLKTVPLYAVGGISDQHKPTLSGTGSGGQFAVYGKYAGSDVVNPVLKGLPSSQFRTAVNTLFNGKSSLFNGGTKGAPAQLLRDLSFLEMFGTQADVNALAALSPTVKAALDAQLKTTTTNREDNGLPGRYSNRPHPGAPSVTATSTAAKTAKGIKDILAGLPQFAVGSGSGIASGIAQGIKQRENTALSAARSLASKLTSQINSIRSTMSQYVSGITGTITGNAGLLNTGNQTTAGIINFEKHQLSIDQAFHRNLAKLVKLGYSPAYISELAQAGPEQAGNIAAQLTTATVGQRNELKRLGRQIGTSAQQTGELAARSYYAKQARQMDALETQLKAVNTNIKAITADLASLARTGHLQTTVRKK